MGGAYSTIILVDTEGGDRVDVLVHYDYEPVLRIPGEPWSRGLVTIIEATHEGKPFALLDEDAVAERIMLQMEEGEGEE